MNALDITLNHVSKTYGKKIVFDNFGCKFSAGKAYCLFGPSGSGKTTLLRMLAGSESCDSGEITGMEGKKISAVFQEDRLFENLGAEKNVMLTSKAGFSRADAQELLNRLGITDTKKAVSEFSGGMKRRCAVARALAAEYDILLLDEPLAGLDETARQTVMQVIFEENKGRTLICATHFREFAAFFSAETIDIPLIQSAG